MERKMRSGIPDMNGGKRKGQDSGIPDMGRRKRKTGNRSVNQEKLESGVLVVLSWIHALLLFAGSYLLAAGFLSMGHREALGYMSLSLVLLVPVAVSWLLIRKIRNFFLYQLAGFGVTALVWFLTSSFLTAALTELVFLIRCHAWIVRASNKKKQQEMMGDPENRPKLELWDIPTLLDSPRIYHLMLQAVIYLGILVTRHYDLLRVMLYLMTAELFVVFLFRYLESQRDFILSSSRIANLPVRTMRRNRQAILAVALAFLVILASPALIYGREPLTGLMDRVASIEVEMPPMEETVSPGGNDGMAQLLEAMAGEQKEPPAWLEPLTNVLTYGILLLALLALVRVVYGLCRRMVRSFAGDGEEDELIFPDQEAEEVYERAARGRKEARWTSPNQAVRRRYRRTILKKAPRSPGGWETPEELEEGAGLGGAEENRYFHEIYEKARYSREGCSKEEARDYGRLRLEKRKVDSDKI